MAGPRPGQGGRFGDRTDAGRRLAAVLAGLPAEVLVDPVVVGLPRGGVPVAAEVATALDAPLDVIVVRKLGVLDQPELAFGALGEDGVEVINDAVVRSMRMSAADVAAVRRREQVVVAERAAALRGRRPAEPVAGRTLILVDDGVATGATMRAACAVARMRRPRLLLIAVPVAAEATLRELRGVADEVVCVAAPRWLGAVGEWYDDFSATTDAEVARLLAP